MINPLIIVINNIVIIVINNKLWKKTKYFYKSKNFASALKLTKPYVNISMVGNHEKTDNH